MISIIIPTHNEEKYLPKLLDSVKKQTYKDYEIIVADAKSWDKTRNIAKKYGCRITEGSHPGIGRNKGAKTAKGDLFLFLDADSVVESDFLEKAVRHMEHRNLDVAGCCLHPSTNKPIDKMFLSAFNAWTLATQKFYANACGSGIFCKRWLHEKINGFDETIKLSEDMDYVRRCSRYGKFGIVKNSKVIFSMRRYEMEGRFSVAFKLLLSVFHRLFLGEIRSDVFKYRMKYKK